MAEPINLRTARKRAKRSQDSERASAARVTHGTPKRLRKLASAAKESADRHLDGHRIEPRDGR